MQPVRIGVSAVALSSIVLVGACSKSADPQVSSQGVQVTASSPATSAPPTTKEQVGTTEPGSLDLDETTTTAKGKATTTKPVKKTGAEFAQSAVEAFKTELGEFKALEITVHPDQPRAQLQAQDPAKPANVDAYEYTGGAVSKPVPVKLSGDGSLEENLFAVGEVAWDKLPTMFEEAKAAIPIEDSKGVTHFIVKKNLPFDSDTVVNIYIDGGARTSGGYVSFLANGTLKKVYGPS